MVSFITFEADIKDNGQQTAQITLNINSISMIEYRFNETIINLNKPYDVEIPDSDRITVRGQSVNTLRNFFKDSHTGFHDFCLNYELDEKAQKENTGSTLPYFIKVTGEKGGDIRDLIINLSNIAVMASK